MSYFERALIVIVLVGALAGLAGVLVVLRKRVLFAQALTHATFPGAIIATILGASLQLGALIACVSLAIILTFLSRIRGQGTQAASGVMLTAGFAAGVLLQAMNPNIPIQIDSFLFGSILSATWVDGILAGAALLVVMVSLLIWGKQIVFFLFDAEAFASTGAKPWVMDAALLLITTIAVVAAMPAAGAILAIALIAAPAAAARYFTDRINVMIWLSPTLGALAGVAGLLLSRWLGVSAGASIALVSATIFFIAWGTFTMRRPAQMGAVA
jgi:manganese/iron transport system permease protein